MARNGSRPASARQVKKEPIKPVSLKRGSRNLEASTNEDISGAKHAKNGANGLNKRIKLENSRLDVSPREQELADIMTDFNMAVNELFQLKEYGSIASWNPSDFSTTTTETQVPEIFQYFVLENNYRLSWGADLEKSLDSVPLRLQKKILAEREEKLLEKYPFKDRVVESSNNAEKALLQSIKALQSNGNGKPHTETKLKQKPSKPAPKPSKEKASIKDEEIEEEDVEEEEEEEEDLDEDAGTRYKLKSVKLTIPPHLITHPSHIPTWRPDTRQNEKFDASEHSIIDFHPKPIEIITRLAGEIHVPEIERKIKNFLTNKYQIAIVDESNNPDYNSTPEEYATILSQQKEMFKKLREKVSVEQSLELHGDKIERRKIVLPNIANTKTAMDPFRSSGTVHPKIQGAVNNQTYWDHLLAQGMAFSRIHQHMRKQRQTKARRVAHMIEQHFRKKKGEGERLAREREQNLKKISRLAIQAVRKRWGQAHKVYRYLELEREDELKKIKGREHLSQMLEHSTQLLEAQLTKSSREATESANESGDNDSQNSDSDDHLSSDSESASEEETNQNLTEVNDKDDMNLTVEQLREKYANMEESVEPSDITKDTAGDSDDEDVEEEDEVIKDEEDDDDIDTSKGLSALYGNEVMAPETATPDYTEDQKKILEEYADQNEKMDITKEVSDTDSDSLSDSGSESDSEGESAEEKTPSKSTGLAALLGRVDNDEDSTDASLSAASMEDSDDDNMSTSEEDEPTTPKSASDLVVEGKESNEEFAEEEVNGSKVRDVPTPFLLRGTLRPYQKQGLNWLASLYNNNTNGILADEMGLGKTIQTISLLSYLACEHHIWGPHLIIVPTSVMLNWEMEFKKFAPGFKVLTYYGSPQQRAMKRKGWNKPDAFHVCITSYQLVVHDHQSFKRRRWKYMILDEAHNIKNFRSTRWKALLNFNTENRLLLTGTPLQNNLMELWSLLYFLMPSSKVNQAMPDGFADLENFQTWFGRPVDRILEQASAATSDVIDENSSTTLKMDEETRNTVARLHQVLRPYLLRRLKKDVEKQMPGKYEHIIYCRLSKRQRYLYDDFMSRAKTKETLASGNFLSIINCLMQLRKVCNHPDLFEVRPIVTSFAMPNCVANTFNLNNFILRKYLADSPATKVSLDILNMDVANKEDLNIFVSQSTNKLKASKDLQNQIDQLDKLIDSKVTDITPNVDDYVEYYKFMKSTEQIELKEKLKQALYLNNLRCERSPIYGESILRTIRSMTQPSTQASDIFDQMITSIPQRVEQMNDVIEKYSVLTPTVVTLDMKDQLIPLSTQRQIMNEVSDEAILNPFHKSQVKLSIAFPDKSLLQYDCGKLQKLALLLQDLTSKGHRALIFTQMTKVLDILEQFLNIHGYRYLRLDGATKIEDRQLLTEQFNRDARIPVFILSTRSGGLGINLTGADTVIFYDSDWNPAMDKQCQDRCHRIGQMRDVHIYRFVSEFTIESNILKKANQKRQLDNVVIQEGEFTTDYFGKFSVRDLVSGSAIVDELPDKPIAENNNVEALAQAEDEDDRAAASAAMQEVAVDDEDFDEENKGTSDGTPGAQTPGAEEVAVKNGELEDADYDEGIGHVDEYMLRFIADGNYVA